MFKKKETCHSNLKTYVKKFPVYKVAQKLFFLLKFIRKTVKLVKKRIKRNKKLTLN